MRTTALKVTIILVMFIFSLILKDPPDFAIGPHDTLTHAFALPGSSDSLCLFVNEGGFLSPASYSVTYRSFVDKKERLLIFSISDPAIRAMVLRSNGFVIHFQSETILRKQFFQFSEILTLANYPLHYDHGKGEVISEAESNQRRNQLNSFMGWILLLFSIIGLVFVLYQEWTKKDG